MQNVFNEKSKEMQAIASSVTANELIYWDSKLKANIKKPLTLTEW